MRLLHESFGQCFLFMSIKVSFVVKHPWKLGMISIMDFQSSEIQILEVYSSIEQSSVGILKNQPDVLVIELDRDPREVARFIATIKERNPSIQVLITTADLTRNELMLLLQSGIGGCIVSTAEADDLYDAIRQIHEGKSPISPLFARKILDWISLVRRMAHSKRSQIQRLTPRENQILTLLAKGLLYKEIAAHLGIKNSTVHNHLSIAYRKLNVRNRTEATRELLRQHADDSANR